MSDERGRHSTPTDAELLDRVRRGDREAFRPLVERYEAQVAVTVVGMLGPGAEADDVGQEVFIRFYRAINQFRGDAALGTYLTRIAMNLSLNALKRRKRQRQRYVSRDEDEQTPKEPVIHGEQEADARERTRLVQQAIQTLNAKHRAVVVLRLIEGYSTKETADILDIPPGTVLSRLARAKDKLKDQLAPYLSHDG